MVGQRAKATAIEDHRAPQRLLGTFQLANDFHVKKFIRDYLMFDSESKGCATLLEWNNIFYEPPEAEARRSNVRVGVVQWQMRSLSTMESLVENIELTGAAITCNRRCQ